MDYKKFTLLASALVSGSAFAASVAPHSPDQPALVITLSDGLIGLSVIAGAAAICVAAFFLRRFVKSRKLKIMSAPKVDIKAPSKEVAVAPQQEAAPVAAPVPTNAVVAYAVGSPNSILETAAALDPIAASHASVVTVEQIRHAKTSAKLMQEKVAFIMKHADSANLQGLVLNSDLVSAEKLARLAHAQATEAMAVADEFKHNHPGAALIWHRAQLDLCLSHLALTRSNLVPALSAWNTGVEKATAKKIEAEHAIEQANIFISAAAADSAEVEMS